jgi:hypothetical protein
MRNTLLQDVIFQIYAGDRADVALDWLKAFGCDELIGGDPGSREVYHPISHPERFHQLHELWRDGADVIYEIPRRNRSLAHAIRREQLVERRPPGYDSAPLKPYLEALDDPSLPPAGFQWRSPEAAAINGSFQRDQLISVQVTWDQGWKARMNGRPLSIWGDSLGQIVIEPRCEGPCTIELSYDGDWQDWSARIISRIAIAAGILWVLGDRIRTRHNPLSGQPRDAA